MFGELPSINDVITGELAAVGHWIVANVVGSTYWTVKVQKARFRELDIFILPATKEGNFPALAARPNPGQSDADVRKILSGFLSALCWTNGGGAIVDAWTGGSRAHTMSGHTARMTRTSEFELDYLPDPADAKGRLALALCREGGAINMATYAVIAYFRVFEIHFQRKAIEIVKWINDNLGSIKDHRAIEVLNTLAKTQADIGQYLYTECRSAAVHGKIGFHPIVDPDDPEDEWRLGRELPLIRALAIKLTEEILGVQTTSTIFREHLYELAGFKARFSQEAVASFVAGDTPDAGTKFDVPNINVGLMGKRVFPSLCGLEPVSLQAIPHGVLIAFRSKNKLLGFEVALDFKEDRLLFDIVDGLSLRDDGSVTAAEMAADLTEFNKFYWSNGRLRIDDADTGEIVARKDAFIPVNVMIRHEGFDAETDRWRLEAKRRAESWGRSLHASVNPARVKVGSFTRET